MISFSHLFTSCFFILNDQKQFSFLFFSWSHRILIVPGIPILISISSSSIILFHLRICLMTPLSVSMISLSFWSFLMGLIHILLWHRISIILPIIWTFFFVMRRFRIPFLLIMIGIFPSLLLIVFIIFEKI